MQSGSCNKIKRRIHSTNDIIWSPCQSVPGFSEWVPPNEQDRQCFKHVERGAKKGVTGTHTHTTSPTRRIQSLYTQLERVRREPSRPPFRHPPSGAPLCVAAAGAIVRPRCALIGRRHVPDLAWLASCRLPTSICMRRRPACGRVE